MRIDGSSGTNILLELTNDLTITPATIAQIETELQGGSNTVTGESIAG